MHTNEPDLGTHQVSISAQEYIDLIQQSVTRIQYDQQFYWPLPRPKRILYRIIFDLLQRLLLSREITLAQDISGQGTERPVTTGRGSWLDAISALTLLGKQRLNNLRWCVEDVLRRDVPGDMIETGVWRGGACILMRAKVARLSGNHPVWLHTANSCAPPSVSSVLGGDNAYQRIRASGVHISSEIHRFDPTNRDQHPILPAILLADH